jgi:hypothetical protein
MALEQIGLLQRCDNICGRHFISEHVRFLAALAFVSPQIIKTIIYDTAPADVTVTQLAKALPYSWVEQERRLGLPFENSPMHRSRHRCS